MKTHKREILIYYHPDSGAHRQVVAYAKTVSKHVRTFSFGRTPSSGTSWQQIIKALDLDPKLLLNKSNPYYQEHLRGREFDEENWIKVLMNNPSLFKFPIAMSGSKAVVCNTPSDIYKLK